MKRLLFMLLIPLVLLIGCAQQNATDNNTEQVWEVTQELNGQVLYAYTHSFSYVNGGTIEIAHWWNAWGNPQDNTIIISGNYRVERTTVNKDFLK